MLRSLLAAERYRLDRILLDVRVQKKAWSSEMKLTISSKILDQVGITDPNFQNKLNGIIGVTNWIEASVFALLVDRIGRRPLFLISNSGMVCTFAVWIALTAVQNNTGDVGPGKGVICMIFFHNFFYNLCW